MRRNELALSPHLASSGAVRRRSPAESLWAVNERLDKTERELRIQFSRIAQLQAQLDVVVGALRRSPETVHV
jgi:hypothetical protein